MRILLATDTYHPNVNGAAYFTYRLAHILADRGHEISVIAPSRTLHNTVTTDDGIVVYGMRSLPIYVVKDFRFSPVPMMRHAVHAAIREVSPDLIHIQNHFLIGKVAVQAAEKHGIPVVGTNHFMPENLVHYLHLPAGVERLVKRFAWRQFSGIYRRLDAVTTPTLTAANLLREVGFEGDVAALSCGIDLQRFNPANEGGYLRTRYAIPPGRPIALHVGRLDKEKRVHVILRAIARLRATLPIHLVLAGVGAERRRLERLAAELGITRDVTFAGFVPDADLPNLYPLADVFVAAGIAELQGIAAMEAMASGLPVVAARAVALPELVREGENGFLFPAGDVAALTEHLRPIVMDEALQHRMGQASLRIIQHHDIRNVVEAFEAIYAKAIERKRATARAASLGTENAAFADYALPAAQERVS